MAGVHLGPIGASGFAEATVTGTEVNHTLKSVIERKHRRDDCNVGDEGGFAPSVQDNNEALDFLAEAPQKPGHPRTTCNIPPSRRCNVSVGAVTNVHGTLSCSSPPLTVES